jgi:alpha-galactosidase
MMTSRPEARFFPILAFAMAALSMCVTGCNPVRTNRAGVQTRRSARPAAVAPAVKPAQTATGPDTAIASPAPTMAPTPPMGWNSWNRFGCNVDERLVRETADALVTSGMKDAGYEYLVIDDCWQVARDAAGNILADSRRFPSGMKGLVDYVHGKGLKFGIYSDAGTKTCGGRPGSRDHEEQDAAQYAAWGVDYLKYDWCYTEGMDARAAYGRMSRALHAAGRPIVLSICEWGQTKPWTWAAGVGHLWRTTGDILDCWDCTKDWGGMGLVHILDLQDGLQAFAGPGHWNDPDMLQVGNGGMTPSEYRAHFSLWALLAAPLMAGNDVRNMAAETRAILLNREAIAIDQDPLGIQGHKVRDTGPHEMWVKPLAGGERAVVLFNRGSVEAKMVVMWEDTMVAPSARLVVRDLWSHRDLGTMVGRIESVVAPHDVVLLRFRPE